MAQLVEQLIRNQQVAGSSPASSSIIVVRKGYKTKSLEMKNFRDFFVLFCGVDPIFGVFIILVFGSYILTVFQVSRL